MNEDVSDFERTLPCYIKTSFHFIIINFLYGQLTNKQKLLTILHHFEQ